MENAVQIIELLIEIYEKKRGDDEISFFPFYFPPRTFLRAFIAAALHAVQPVLAMIDSN